MPGARTHIRQVKFRRFKQFRDAEVSLEPGVSLLAGGNNSGKSSLLHGLAVWEFCRTATLMERGDGGLLKEAITKQGFGLGDDEFSPINVPSLKHLWTNLRTQKEKSDPDGYTLRITCEWGEGADAHELGFGLSLVNDRLFIKVASSDLEVGDPVPRIAYLPPFAGITAREERISGAIRRRRVGEGLAGAVLRNLLLDMQKANTEKRSAYLREAHERSEQRSRERGGVVDPAAAEARRRKAKISESDLRKLRTEDPWELLQQTLRQAFKTELQVEDFREEYHSYINVEVVKGTVQNFLLKRHPHYASRDLMVEGSGFLQWLSVYTLATTPELDVLLFDEPDAHLHPTLQRQLLARLEELATTGGRQVLLATHSSEILRGTRPTKILEIRSGGKARYLQEEDQKVGLMEGLGSDYAPRLDRIKATKRVIFFEGSSDLAILQVFSQALGLPWPDSWVSWQTTHSQKDRRSLWRALNEEIKNVVAFSLRDRDDDPLATVGSDLSDTGERATSGFYARKWRRRYIEAYLLWPPALAASAGLPESEVREVLQEKYGIAVGGTFTDSNAPQALLDVRAKEILSDLKVKAVDVAKQMPPEAICVDIQMILEQIAQFD